jgi:hypothetical protein
MTVFRTMFICHAAEIALQFCPQGCMQYARLGVRSRCACGLQTKAFIELQTASGSNLQFLVPFGNAHEVEQVQSLTQYGNPSIRDRS